ncbi:MAG: hypothetical protein OXC95_11645, partial [Dehalococcoidia bacterium]|nr:hypothetical protein [Dehalococcoidia bacterium]
RNSSKISILSLAIVVLLALSFYFSKDDAVALSMLGHLLYYTTLRDTTTSGKARAKRTLVNFVKDKLGVSNEEPFLGEGQPFRNWAGPSSFTIRQWEW